MPFKSCHIRTLSPSTSWSLSGAEGPTKGNDFLGPSTSWSLSGAEGLRDQKIRSFIALRPMLLIISMCVKAVVMRISSENS